MDRSTYGLPVHLLAQITGVHIDTARRWKRSGRIPQHFAKLVALTIEGDLGNIANAWKGFRMANGNIHTPEGDAIRPGDLRAIPYRLQLIAELERELARARAMIVKTAPRCRTRSTGNRLVAELTANVKP